MSLTIPPGALPSPQTIVITSTTARPPTSFSSWSSPLYRFEPAGLVFAIPATVRMTFTADGAANHSIFWTRADGNGFENIGGTVSGLAVTAQVSHFSEGFVAPGSGPPMADAAPTADASVDAAADAASTDAISIDAPPVDAPAIDASIDAASDGATCASLGQACQSSTECCSASCIGGICSAATCTAIGQSCSTSTQCCSGNCAGGLCACAAGLTLCPSGCVNVATDPANCGSCGHACALGQGCAAGQCGVFTGRLTAPF